MCHGSVLLNLHHNSHPIPRVPPRPAEEQPSSCFCEDRTPPLCWVPDPQRGLCQHAGPSECKRNPDDKGFHPYLTGWLCLGGRHSSSRCCSTKQIKDHPTAVAARSRHTRDQPGTPGLAASGAAPLEQNLSFVIKSDSCIFISGGSSPPRWRSGVAEWNKDAAGWAGWQEVMSQQFWITAWLTSGQLFHPSLVSSLISHLLLNKSSTWWKQEVFKAVFH